MTNPIASDQALLRSSLLPGVWKNITENAKHRESFRLFEIGLEIHKPYEGLPDEAPHLVAAIYDRQGDGEAGLFEIKRAAECLLPGAQVIAAEAAPYEHPARAAESTGAENAWDGSSSCTRRSSRPDAPPYSIWICGASRR